MRERDERGAILVMAVLLMTVVMTFTAFAVDLGTQRVARRDMQSLADAASMDLARQLRGRSAATILADPAWGRIRNESVLQNDTTVGETPALTSVLGTVDNATGAFTPVAGSAVPTAVKVIAATSVGFAFVPGDGKAARSAVATSSDPLVCFSVSPTALTVDTSGSALAPLLDQILRVRLNVLSSAGLLDVRGIRVPLADIAVELGAVTPQAVLNLSNVSLQGLVLASATALSKNGYTAEAAVLKAIGLQISGAYVNLAKILTLDTANSAGLAASIDVFDLVTAGIFAANGTSSVNVKNLSLVVPGLGGVQELTATVTEPPQIACGKAGVTAKSAQVKIHLKSAIDPLTIGAADVKLELDVDLGRGEGTLSSLVCGAGGAATAVIRTRTGAATVSGPSVPDHLGLLSLTLLKTQWDALPLGTVLKLLLGSSVLAVKAQIGATAAQGGPTDLTFAMPSGTTSVASQTVSATNVLNLQLKGTTVTLLDGSLLGTLLGALLTPLLDAVVNGVVTPLVNGPVNSLLSGVLYPVLSLLGIKIAQTEVAIHGKADCTTVKLVG
ncbi:MAG: pilus assembly protein TadG-related protein [Aeromicrobium sp.]